MAAVHPPRAIEGGRVTLTVDQFPVDRPNLPDVRVGDHRARVAFASASRVVIVVPGGIARGGPLPVRIDGGPDGAMLHVGAPLATGLHQVDSPVFDRAGNLYVTYSGTRGQEVPVSIFRVGPDGSRETFASGIVNATSMALGPDGHLYVSSRFEGTVYRVDENGKAEAYATDLGVACGLAFAPDGTLFVGDRSGTIFKVDRGGQAKAFASLPGSVAAFHLALSPAGVLYATAPTLAAYDAVYEIVPDGTVRVRSHAFGRPQGLGFDTDGRLCVVEALAGASGVYRLPPEGDPDLMVAGPGLVGVAFDRAGTLVVCSNDTAYRF